MTRKWEFNCVSFTVTRWLFPFKILSQAFHFHALFSDPLSSFFSLKFLSQSLSQILSQTFLSHLLSPSNFPPLSSPFSPKRRMRHLRALKRFHQVDLNSEFETFQSKVICWARGEIISRNQGTIPIAARTHPAIAFWFEEFWFTWNSAVGIFSRIRRSIKRLSIWV